MISRQQLRWGLMLMTLGLFNKIVIADGLHMNDWGYACFAQILGDDIIRSVGQIKLGVNVPADVRTYRPM